MINTDVLKGKWMQIRGKVKEQWGKINDNDLDKIDGKREQLVGMLQEKYGYARDKANQEVEQFLKRLNIH